VRALLHYNFLKSWRDASLIAFLIMPALLPAAGLIGATFSKGFHYPLFMGAHYTAAQSAAEATEVASLMTVFFATIPAFWVMRTEIATHSVASLSMAARPLTIVLSIIGYAATIVYFAWVIGVLSVGVLTTAMSPTLATQALKVVVLTLGSSALGALAVTISPEPAMILAAYLTSFGALLLFEKKKALAPQLLAYGIGAIVFVALATYFLERRCAR
jgi:hypothetical protein